MKNIPINQNSEIPGIIEQRGRGVNKFRATGNEFLGWVQFAAFSSDPSTANWTVSYAGRIWFNTTTKTLKCWTGTEVREIAFT